MTDFKRHRVEWLDGVMLVAGGSRGTLSSEKCTLNANGDFNCVEISPSLSGYYLGASFVVSVDYCA